MTFTKVGESISISSQNIKDTDSVFADPEIIDRFNKFAKELKIIAPKANDFLYFNCIMMHAAEAALIDEQGNPLKDKNGNIVIANWEKFFNKKGEESVRWMCSDSEIKPYKNKNGDIFSEIELKKAYRNWVGKPLCVDHKSDSAEFVRGIIVDTYYDDKLKRVIAMCALDKKNYPELARNIQTGLNSCVSMGTGVSLAICYDCGNTARVESDFCDCMRYKRCYGEINVGLNPIELSLVVNGADPKAKVKLVLAAANALSKYIESNQPSNEILNKLNALSYEIEEIKKLAQNTEISKDNLEIPNNDTVLSFMGKLAHNVEELTIKVNGFLKEKEMANKKGFWQGTEEPTPGQPKYQVDPTQDKLRDSEDKQMVGQSPFPGVGDIEKMYPGYASFGETEEARKRRLQRMANLKKAKENLAKNSFYQGTEEPTPGKPKYPVDPTQDKLRVNEDKQMVGQPPFPDVGPVDGLHPSPASADQKDELKRKQMLQRAEDKMRAKLFTVNASDGTLDPKKTRWEIYTGNKLVVNASLWDVAGNKFANFVDNFSSKTFAQKLMNKIRVEGAANVQSFLKKAQTPPAMPAMPAQTSEMSAGQAPPMGDAGAMPGMESPDAGGTGDPSKEIPEKLTEMENVLADLRKGFQALTGSESQNELNGFQSLTESGAMPPEEAKALAMEKKLNYYLVKGFKETGEKLASLYDDLKVAKQIAKTAKNISDEDRVQFNKAVADSLVEAQEAISNAHMLKNCFVEYVHGRDMMIRKAAKMQERIKKAQTTGPSKADMTFDPTKPVAGRVYEKGDPFMPADATPGVPYQPSAGSASEQKPAAKPAVAPSKRNPPKTTVGPEKIDDKLPPAYPREHLEKMLESGSSAMRGQDFSGKAQQTPTGSGVTQQIGDKHDLKMSPDGGVEGSPEEVGKVMKEKEASLNTKDERAKMRAKLAEKALSFSDMLKVHKGGVVPGGMPNKDLGKVETLEEVNKQINDLAKAPPQVRKQAEDIQKLVSLGQIDPKKDFESLIANGVDPAAVQYWKKYFSQVDGGSEFATELVKEHAKAKYEESLEAHKVKLARAWEIANEAAAKGLINGSQDAIKKQADEIMLFDDTGFENFKNFIGKQPFKKQASIPSVGNQNWFDVKIPDEGEALQNQFAQAFAGRKY